MADKKFSIIKCDDGNNNVLVHKSLITDFNAGSLLIVNESQTALFFKDGIAEGPFPAGRHTLTTNNFPVFRKKFALLYSRNQEKNKENESPFACEVYFINMVSDLTLLWGTPNPLQLEDPKYHLILNVGARGNTKVRVVDPMRFVVRICGQIQDYTFEKLKTTIKSDMLPIVTSLISQTINRGQVSVLEINDNLLELSEKVLAKLNERLADFGLEALHFNIENIEAGEADLLKLKQAKERYLSAMTDIDIEAIKTTRMAEARAEARRREGTTYREERQFDVLDSVAKNEGSAGNTMGATMGLGMGFGIGNAMSPVVQETVKSAMVEKTCKKCGAEIPQNGKFCPSCGTPVAQANICVGCGNELPLGCKFCPSCGKIQNSVCSNCGNEVPAGFKFCPNCGTEIR